MRKPQFNQPKRQGGLSLIPALWDEIDRVASLAGVPRNRVIETALMEKFLPSGVPQKVMSESQVSRTEDTEMEALPA